MKDRTEYQTCIYNIDQIICKLDRIDTYQVVCIPLKSIILETNWHNITNSAL